MFLIFFDIFLVFLKMTTKKIPVAKHIKKYLIYNFGKHYIFSKKDWISPLISGLLKRGYRTRIFKTAEDFYEIKISDDEIKRLGRIIEWERVGALNFAIDQIFRKHLFLHMDMNRKLNSGVAMQTMVQYLEEMNITEEDISFDTLYRDYRRKQKYKKSQVQNISKMFNENTLGKLPPNFGQVVHG